MAKKTLTADEAVASEAVSEDVTQDEPEKLMYVGPTIAGVGIQNRVYTEIPEGAKEAFKEVPEMRNLFVPILTYPAAETMIRTKKGYIFSAYRKALEFKESRNGGIKA
jgi:hypothetical protein